MGLQALGARQAHGRGRKGFERARIRYRDGVDHFGLPYARILQRALNAAEEDSQEQS